MQDEELEELAAKRGKQYDDHFAEHVADGMSPGTAAEHLLLRLRGSFTPSESDPPRADGTAGFVPQQAVLKRMAADDEFCAAVVGEVARRVLT